MYQQFSKLDPIPLEILTGSVLGALLGFMLLKFGSIFSLAIFGVLVLAVILLKAPEIGVLIVLVFASGILPEALNPYVNLFVGHSQVSDLILIALLALALLKWIMVPGFRYQKTPLNLPIFLFCIAVLIGIGTAVLNHGIRFSDTTFEARTLLFYSLFFAVTNLIRTKKQLQRLVYGIFAIGLAAALLIILDVVLRSTKVDLLRVFSPGYTAVYITMMVFICLLPVGKSHAPRLTTYIFILILGGSVLFSLGRSVILSTFLSLIVLLYIFLHRDGLVSLLTGLLVLAVVSVGIFAVLTIAYPTSPILDYPQNLVGRLSQLLAPNILTSPYDTLLWRVQETRFAWEQILQHPILGIGLRTEYRPDFFQGDTLQSYIHNGYLWVWLKTGLLGLIPFLWFLFAFLARGFRKWMDVSNEILRAFVLGFTLVIFAMFFCNFFAPYFVWGFNLAFFSAGMGIVEVITGTERETP